MARTPRTRWTGLVAALALLPGGCSNDGNSGGGGIDLSALVPSNPGSDYAPVNEPAAQAALAADMWATLVAPSCWDASAAGPIAVVSQFQFSGQDQYRFVGGTDIFFGAIFLHSIGHYQGRQTAILETWTGVVEAIVILDGATIAHVFPNPANTAIVVTRYGTSNGPCL